ncbi:hypothetical protein IV203_033557 [Nitzschia inconspicua]|uniref:Uncharacterized protein n=1 Tax=Nitzschia inconspicua TaxID=303405 RepID=A0A9K3M222_9STRA|nr:hypothetical protein IV203_023746 [Nitzschia inconspicua]KAG7372833.1 hypothetical protein IV203_033557 [Nitzschia inconspicua]
MGQIAGGTTVHCCCIVSFQRDEMEEDDPFERDVSYQDSIVTIMDADSIPKQKQETDTQVSYVSNKSLLTVTCLDRMLLLLSAQEQEQNDDDDKAITKEKSIPHDSSSSLWLDVSHELGLGVHWHNRDETEYAS